MDTVSERWIKSGLCWVVFTMSYGMYAGISEQFALASSHAHGGILGGLWAIAFAWLYHRKGGDTASGHALYQWLLYNLGVVGMVVALNRLNSGHPEFAPLIGGAGLVVLATTAWIVLDLWPRKR